jgi:hypothetical protein
MRTGKVRGGSFGVEVRLGFNDVAFLLSHCT